MWVGNRDRLPDVAVTCDEYNIAEAPDVLHSPNLSIDVLSAKRSGELDEKLKEYQSRPSIEEYIVIDSRRRAAAIFPLRWPAGLRQSIPRVAGSVILTSINHMLDIDELYRLVRFRGV